MKLNNEEQIVAGCKLQKPKWQKELFDGTVDYMRAVCIRYTDIVADTDDILQEGFIKVFAKITDLEWRGDGSLFFWVKRIMVNTAIDYYRKNKSNFDDFTEIDSLCDDGEVEFEYSDSDYQKEHISVLAIYDSQLSESDLIAAVSKLPQPFRLTFNLFAIEGLKHKDIAEVLGISIKTSTTRVLRAKKLMQVILAEICAEKITSIA